MLDDELKKHKISYLKNININNFVNKKTEIKYPEKGDFFTHIHDRSYALKYIYSVDNTRAFPFRTLVLYYNETGNLIEYKYDGYRGEQRVFINKIPILNI